MRNVAVSRELCMVCRKSRVGDIIHQLGLPAWLILLVLPFVVYLRHPPIYPSVYQLTVRSVKSHHMLDMSGHPCMHSYNNPYFHLSAVCLSTYSYLISYHYPCILLFEHLSHPHPFAYIINIPPASNITCQKTVL